MLDPSNIIVLVVGGDSVVFLTKAANLHKPK